MYQLAQGMQADPLLFVSLKRTWWQEMTTEGDFCRNPGDFQGIIVVEETLISKQHFPAVQKFTLEHGNAPRVSTVALEHSCSRGQPDGSFLLSCPANL
jgi:hypothetical protein